ncbi:tRNA pseudouridine(38-40) synthase TruA [Pleomorphovibrio marinus]|uniref:tRNA pseudouridine(38-40) synthase TruA n=1 Tax=Pleomorphovibrio marinus TaxID=2164132 RepID=UPI000E0BBC9F|nr:tRNA pseudouridine(38-40) synthase TruA [Pleomorphovibrio marinus]
MEFRQKYFLELQYKGTNFHGWQVQPNAITVQSVLESSLTTLLKCPTPVMGSGRTDTGVHALQQFAHFETNEELDYALFLKKLNGILPKDIAAKQLYSVPMDAHARFDAISREYKYFVHLQKNPFYEGRSWYCPYEVNLQMMNDLARMLLKQGDFECFSKVKTNVNHFHCEIKKAFWEQKGEQMIFHIVADRFLRGMVRAIVGTLLLAGRGKLDEKDFKEILESRNRSKAGAAAPPGGLFLAKVAYPPDLFTYNLDKN